MTTQILYLSILYYNDDFLYKNFNKLYLNSFLIKYITN